MLNSRVESTSTYEWDERPPAHVDFACQYPDCEPLDFLEWPQDAAQSAELAAILCCTAPTSNNGPTPQLEQEAVAAPAPDSTQASDATPAPDSTQTGLVEEGPTYTVLSPSPVRRSLSSSSTSTSGRPIKPPRRRGSSRQSLAANDGRWYNRDLVINCRVTLWHAVALALAFLTIGLVQESLVVSAPWISQPQLPLRRRLMKTSNLLDSYINAVLPRFPQANGEPRGGGAAWINRILRRPPPQPPALPPRSPKSPPSTRTTAHNKQDSLPDADMSPPRTTRRPLTTRPTMAQPPSRPPPPPPKWDYQPIPPYTQTPFGYQPQGLAEATRPPLPWYRRFLRGLGHSTRRVTEQSIASAAGTSPMLAFAAIIPPQQAPSVPMAPPLPQPVAPPLPQPMAPPASPRLSPNLQRPRTDSDLPAYYPQLPRSDPDTVEFDHDRLRNNRPQMPRTDPDGDVDSISVDSNNVPRPRVHQALRDGVFVADRFDRYGPAFNLATIPEDAVSRTHCLARASLCQRLTGYLTITVATGAGAAALGYALSEFADDPAGLEKWTDEAIESFVQTYGISAERVIQIIKRVDLDTYRTAELLVSALRQATTINKEFGRPLTYQLTPMKNDSLLSPVHQIMMTLSTDFDPFMTYLVDTSQFAESVGRVKRSLNNHRRRRFVCGDPFTENDSLAWAECLHDFAKKNKTPPALLQDDVIDEVVNPYSEAAAGTLQDLFTSTPPPTTTTTEPPVDCASLVDVAQQEHSAAIAQVNDELDVCNAELQQTVALAAENAKTTNDTVAVLRSALKATSASRDYHKNNAEENHNKARIATAKHDSATKRLIQCNSANANMQYKLKAATIAHRDSQIAGHRHLDNANTFSSKLSQCESHLSECTRDNRDHRNQHATCTNDLKTANRLLVNAGNTLRQLAEAPETTPPSCSFQLIPGIPNAIVRFTWFCFLGALGGVLAALLFALVFVCRRRCRGYQPQVDVGLPGHLNNANYGQQPPPYGAVPPPGDRTPPPQGGANGSQRGSPDGSRDNLVMNPANQSVSVSRQSLAQ